MDADSEESFRLSHLSPEHILAASEPVPDSLLLRRSRQTREDVVSGAWAAACAFVLFFLPLPACLVLYLVKKTTDSGPCAIAVLAVLVGSVAGWVFWKEVRVPGAVYRRAEILDFETRMWRSQTAYPQADLPDKHEAVSLDEVVLVCHLWIGEDMERSYEVAMRRRADLRNNEGLGLAALHLQSFSDKEAGMSFVLALAARWQLEAWSLLDGDTTPRKLAPLPLKDESPEGRMRLSASPRPRRNRKERRRASTARSEGGSDAFDPII